MFCYSDRGMPCVLLFCQVYSVFSVILPDVCSVFCYSASREGDGEGDGEGDREGEREGEKEGDREEDREKETEKEQGMDSPQERPFPAL